MTTKKLNMSNWAPLAGKWSFETKTAKFIGPEEKRDPFGLAISGNRIRQGILNITVQLDNPIENSARIVFGYDSNTKNYFSIGIGGYGRAYLLDEFNSGRGWGGLALQGTTSNIQAKKYYDLRVELHGQRVSLYVDDVKVIEANLPHPLQGDQVGIFAWGSSPVNFNSFNIEASPPKAFVIMQFSEPFNSFFRHVIQPVSKRVGLDAFRSSDVYKPGIILEDILRDILQSEIIIAEVTSGNPNVYYELGYAHALKKQTILLADSTIPQLPFDIRGYRVIFYENTIKGKPEVEYQLEEHIKNIMLNNG